MTEEFGSGKQEFLSVLESNSCHKGCLQPIFRE